MLSLPVLVVVAHVEDDPELVVGAALGEEHDGVQEFLNNKEKKIKYSLKNRHKHSNCKVPQHV